MADHDNSGPARIRILVLPALDIRAAEGTELRALLRQPKRVALLIYMAIAKAGGFHRRDTLLALFWPELDESHARGALSQALSYLRHALGTEVLVNRGSDEVGLDPERFWCDAVEFEKRITAGDDAAALALYQGELLEGFFLSDAPFEQWLDGERRRLHELARAAARRLTARCEAAKDPVGALRWARHSLGLAPYDEPSLRQLVALLDLSGDRAGAIHEYELFATRLRAELEVDPSPETLSAVEAIRNRYAPNGLQQTGRVAPTATDAPAGVVPAAGSAPPAYRQPRTTGYALAVAAAALVLLTGGGTIVARAGGDDLEPRRIVVIPFENQTGDAALAPVGRIAADWILQGLARADVVEVVPGIDVSERLQEMQRTGRAADTTGGVQALARALRAGTALVGSYHRRGEDLEFQVQVIDIARGRLIHAVDGIRGRQRDPMAAIDDLRRRTLGAIAVKFDARIPPELYSAFQPPNYESYRAFAAGEDLRNRWEWRKALAYFRQAYTLDTTFTTALLLAAIQHFNLREYAQADSLTRILARSRERLPGFERQLLEWVEAMVRGDLPGTLDASRGMTRFGDAFHGQRAADALHANRPRDAIDALTALDTEGLSERRPLKWQVASGNQITEAYHRLGSYHRELKEANRARRRHADVVATVLWEMRALIALGRIEDARDRLEEALVMTPDADWPPGEIMLRAADELRAHGHTGPAREILLGALAWYARYLTARPRCCAIGGISRRPCSGPTVWRRPRRHSENSRSIFRTIPGTSRRLQCRWRGGANGRRHPKSSGPL